jgi:hypothetical protein
LWGISGAHSWLISLARPSHPFPDHRLVCSVGHPRASGHRAT